MQDFDQRNVRKVAEGFKALGSSMLCNTCGRQDNCAERNGLAFAVAHRGLDIEIKSCKSYMPVISFNNITGVDKTFNTFRRGAGCYRRMPVGTPVRFYDLTAKRLLPSSGMVTETHLAPLGQLLEQHAAYNHMLRDGMYADAETRLLKILVQAYGRNYSSLDAEFSVIYCDVEDANVKVPAND